MAQIESYIPANLYIEDTLNQSVLKLVRNAVINKITANYNVTIFKAEENFDIISSLKWFQDKKCSTPFYWVAAYLLVIFGGRQIMKTRERFTLQGLLVLWNFGLASFSLLGAIRIIPELVHTLFNKPDGFYHSVCNDSCFQNKVFAYWYMLIVLSKVVELGDTVFIILRKQPLIFLHWYHHVTVLVFMWFSGAEGVAMGRFAAINLVIHSSMYTYYGLRAMKVKIPKPIAIAITSSQLLQMVMGLIVVLSALLYKKNSYKCAATYNILYFGFGIFASQGALFAHFFYKAYLAPNGRSSEAAVEVNKHK